MRHHTDHQLKSWQRQASVFLCCWLQSFIAKLPSSYQLWKIMEKRKGAQWVEKSQCYFLLQTRQEGGHRKLLASQPHLHPWKGDGTDHFGCHRQAWSCESLLQVHRELGLPYQAEFSPVKKQSIAQAWEAGYLGLSGPKQTKRLENNPSFFSLLPLYSFIIPASGARLNSWRLSDCCIALTFHYPS